MPKIPERRWWERDSGGAIVGARNARLDQTENAINELAVEHTVVHRQLEALFALDRAQGDVDRLQAVVGVLLDIVLDKGLVEEAELSTKLAEVAEAFPEPPALAERPKVEAATDPFVIAPRKAP